MSKSFALLNDLKASCAGPSSASESLASSWATAVSERLIGDFSSSSWSSSGLIGCKRTSIPVQLEQLLALPFRYRDLDGTLFKLPTGDLAALPVGLGFTSTHEDGGSSNPVSSERIFSLLHTRPERVGALGCDIVRWMKLTVTADSCSSGECSKI